MTRARLNIFIEHEHAKRLDRLSRQFDRLERDQNILIETVSLYVRIFLTVSLPVPEGHQEAARAQGRARYAQFIEQLARHIQRGRSLVREIHEEVEPELRGPAAGDSHEPPEAETAEGGLPQQSEEVGRETQR